MLEPLEFIARLADLASKPRMKLTRYHSLFSLIVF
jgi:hypothetical protein